MFNVVDQKPLLLTPFISVHTYSLSFKYYNTRAVYRNEFQHLCIKSTWKGGRSLDVLVNQHIYQILFRAHQSFYLTGPKLNPV